MKPVEMRKWARYFEARNLGKSVEASARFARISPSTAYRFERQDPTSTGLEAAHTLGITHVAGNLVDAPLDPAALRALEDFAYFRLRYFGRKSTPWQERAAYDVLRAVQSDQREFIVINCPPGSGKSTLFTHDIMCWLIARDRTIRIMIGSRTERQARMYVGRIKRSLERDAPLRASADDQEAGLAVDAEAALQDDYGAFRPEGRSDLWRAEALVVRQTDGVSLDDKEPTVSAWGQDSGFLGGRFDLVIWDDLVDRKNTRTPEAKETLRDWWAIEAETRVEPGGAMILQGQRISHDDLYRYCLDARTLTDDPKYQHIKYVAHDDTLCREQHSHDAPAWPKGCLLDPWRLPWQFLQTIKRNNPRTYAVQYQQEDGDIIGGLVDPAWIQGGIDKEGYPAPGCLDAQRKRLEIPPHLTGDRSWSFVTVDPSPTEWWGIIWWLYDPDTNTRHIIDVIRRRLNPEQFLSLDLDRYEYSGVLVDLVKYAASHGVPIRDVIVEVNAAQRWLLQQPHVQRWIDATSIRMIPHQTGINKNDPKFGVESVGDYFRQGFVRIPWGDPDTRLVVEPLITELVQYPEGETTDLVMSTWFHTLAVNNHYSPRNGNLYRKQVPQWVAPTRRRGAPDIQRGLHYVV